MYNLNTEKGRKIKMICIRMKIKIKEILPEQYLEPVGYLAGIEGIEPTGRIFEGTGFDEEMLLMKGFDQGTLDRFLREFSRNRIERVDLKAVLTPGNVRWSSLELYEEIKKEHEALH